jgi:hypothetical protein
MVDTIYPALRAFLLADADIAAAVDDRIVPWPLDQGIEFPAITITKISGIRIGNLSGPATLARPRYQIDYWTDGTAGADAFLEAESGGALIRNRLEAYVGTWTDTRTSPPLTIKVSIDFEDERDLFEADAALGPLYRHSADYTIWHGTVGA